MALLRCAAVAVAASPLLAWLATWAVTGSPWLPGSGGLRYLAVSIAVLAAFYLFEDLAAVARHRGEDADALTVLDLPGDHEPGPAGVDVVVDTPHGPLAVVVIGAAGPLAVDRGRHLVTPSHRRRGVSLRRLRRAAEELGAAAVVVAPRCERLSLGAHVEGGTVHVLGATEWVALTSQQGLAPQPAPATEHERCAQPEGAETTWRTTT